MAASDEVKVNTIYTLGYIGSSHEDLRKYIEATGAILCDIRMSPYSKAPMWQGKNIEATVGRDNYLHLRELGNRNYKNGGPLDLADERKGVETVMEIMKSGRSVILMCACADWWRCHRADAAWAVAEEYAVLNKSELNRVNLPAKFARWTRE